VLADASTTLRDRFQIAHATLQIETAGDGDCQGADW
jgi:cobalt-zinc-cadmium efflux system protein